MKILVMVAIAVGALAFVATDDQADARKTNSSPWESRVAQVDGYLSEGLSGDTHRKIAGPVGDSADAVVGFGNVLDGFVE